MTSGAAGIGLGLGRLGREGLQGCTGFFLTQAAVAAPVLRIAILRLLAALDGQQLRPGARIFLLTTTLAATVLAVRGWFELLADRPIETRRSSDPVRFRSSSCNDSQMRRIMFSMQPEIRSMSRVQQCQLP